MKVREAAALYLSKGWEVVPLAPKSKACVDGDWLKLKFKVEDFRDGDNLGIRSVNGLVDVDNDCAEVVAMAAAFLPKTGAVYGRKSKPRAHFLYQSAFERTIALKDHETGTTLVEIRVNHQSMAPPSVHPDGEVLAWENGTAGDATPCDATTLRRAVGLMATAALTARYYPGEGGRHEWGIALAGLLRKLGLEETEANLVFLQAGKYVGDGKIGDRLNAVKGTWAKDEASPLKGAKALKDLMAAGASFVASLRKIWGAADSEFICNDAGKVLANSQENVRRALAREEVELSHDLFADRLLVRVGRETTARTIDDATVDRLWLRIDERYHFRPSFEFFEKVLRDEARKTAFHPVRDYLDALEWDGAPRVDRWLETYCGAADSEYTRAVGALVLVAAVRRVRQPGCKFDELLVLESDRQGLGKSSALRALCPLDSWFSDDLPLSVDAKQTIERTSGKWIVEAAELAGLHKSQVEQLKAMLSRQVDGPARMAYARLAVEAPRQFIMIGTTNSYRYLKDGHNRRFWPVRVERFDLAKLAKDRNQLWAEAARREADGESIRLAPSLYPLAELQQERRRAVDPWESSLDERLARSDKHRLTNDDVWTLLGIVVKDRDERANTRVLAVMQRLGFRRVAVRRGDVVSKGWGRDPEGTSHDLPFEGAKDHSE
jgi:hypothetical protein